MSGESCASYDARVSSNAVRQKADKYQLRTRRLVASLRYEYSREGFSVWLDVVSTVLCPHDRYIQSTPLPLHFVSLAVSDGVVVASLARARKTAYE
jgi:hypothetical protein